MSRKSSSLAAVAASLVALTAMPAAHAAPVGEFTDYGDIGAPKHAGRTTYNAASQEYVLSGSGTNMWGARDEFHYAWRKLSGDFILQARVTFVGSGVEAHRKAGWIVRSSLDADAPYVSAAVHGDGLISQQTRATKGGETAEVVSPAKGADVIQLERRGNTYLFSAARFGEPYQTTQIELDAGTEPYIGLFVCAHNAEVVEQAVFSNVRIIRPAKADFVPYRDYIGSHLELLDVQSGKRELIYSSID